MADLPGVAAVLQDAFSDKMQIMFGKQPEKVIALLEAAYTGPVQRGYDGVLVAEQGGRIIGTLLIAPMYYTLRENRIFEHVAVRELGMPRMLWTSFLLWLLSHNPARRSLYQRPAWRATGRARASARCSSNTPRYGRTSTVASA
jgi:hypothetical protein